MEEQIKDIQQISRKQELTEELENTTLISLINSNKLFEERISINDIIKLKKAGINTLGELLKADTDVLYQILISTEPSIRNHINYWRLRDTIMEMGFLYDDDREEYESIGVSDYVALIPLEKLEISQRIKNSLDKRCGILYLGDLLNYDYESLKKIRTLGKEGIMELKNYIHSLGYSLKNENKYIFEVKQDYKEKGILMIQEELELDNKTVATLYNNGIYTVKDLIKFGPSVFSLVGMGNLKTKRIKEAMASRNIKFEDQPTEEKKEELPVKPPEEVINILKEGNTFIKKRIEKKEKLLSEYEGLIAEREELLKREKILDAEIKSKIKMLESINSKEEETNYGRR